MQPALGGRVKVRGLRGHGSGRGVEGEGGGGRVGWQGGGGRAIYAAVLTTAQARRTMQAGGQQGEQCLTVPPGGHQNYDVRDTWFILLHFGRRPSIHGRLTWLHTIL